MLFRSKSIPYTENSDTIMLIDEASNLNLDYDSIDRKLHIKTCRSSISSVHWINLNNDRYTSKGSIINEKLHEVLLQSLVSDQNSEMQYLLETFKRTMNESSQRNLRKLYSTHKPIVKMKLNKLLAAQIIIPIHARRGRAMKLKFTRY